MDEPVAGARPNPLGTGQIKLTMPARRGKKRDSGVSGGQEALADADVRGGDVVAAGGEQGAPGAATEGDSDLLVENVSGAREWDDDDGPTRYTPDRKIVQALAALIAVVAVVVSGLVWWFSSPDPAPPQRGRVIDGKPSRPAAGGGPSTAATSAVAASSDGPLPVTLTAVCPGQTDPKLASADDQRSAWQCPTQGVPFGQKLVGTLPKPYVITGIKFWPGFNGTGPDGRDAWPRHRVLKEVQFLFNDTNLTTLAASPDGERQECDVVVDHLVATQVQMTVLDSVAPPPAAPTSAPSSTAPDAPSLPTDVPLFAPSPTDTPDGANAPDASSIAVTGFQLIGHPIG